MGKAIMLNKSDKYRLIETITTTEVIQNVVRTQEPDGTPYNYKRLVITAAIPQATGNNASYATINGKWETRLYLPNSLSTAESKWVGAEFTCETGLLFGRGVAAGLNNETTTISSPGLMGYLEMESITKVEFGAYGSSNPLPTGTIIKIWVIK